jgi:hypothetical protein
MVISPSVNTASIGVSTRLREVILPEASGQFWAKICATENEEPLMDANER